MKACLRPWLVALALLALPAAALATDNVWPVSPGSWSEIGAQVAYFDGFEAMPDGAGGYYVAWDAGAVILQHVLASGRFAWAPYQVTLGPTPSGRGSPVIAPDGFGGMFVAYELGYVTPPHEYRVQRLNPDGTPASGWPQYGVPISFSPYYDFSHGCDVVADGSGGAFVSFIRPGDFHTVVSHVTSQAVLDPAWPAGGVDVQQTGQTIVRPQLFTDGEGGALVVRHEIPSNELRVSRVDRYGYLHPEAFPGAGLLLGTGVSQDFAAAQEIYGAVTVAWADSRTGSREIYTDAVYAYGLAGWAPPGGLQLTFTPGVQEDFPSVTTDTGGNLLFAWLAGTTIRGTRMYSGFQPHPSFPIGGVVVSPSVNPYVRYVALASDGTGGMLAAWHGISQTDGMFAQRLTPDGVVAHGWSPTGVMLATVPGGGYFGGHPIIFHDGDHGLIGVFNANGSLATNRLRRNATHGLLTAPVLTALNDVANDQGGRLSLYWRASEKDTTPSNPVGSYMTWRRMPAIFAQKRIASGARMVGDGDSPELAGPGAIRAIPSATTTIYWEYLGSTPARGWTGYGMTVSTDSDLLGPMWPVPWETFMVEAVSPLGVVLGTSAPDSGFSLDNLSPGPPAAFTAARSGGATHLHWSRSFESDFGHYRLHRGSSADFVPDDANLVAAIADTGFVDPTPGVSYYKLAVLDIHSNASPYALVTPGQTLDVADAAAASLSFAPVAPNPARGRVTLSFTLPHAGHVRLEVFDTQGRRVRALSNAPHDAGTHAQQWDLRDDGGRALAAGLYLARIETAAGALTRRFVVVE